MKFPLKRMLAVAIFLILLSALIPAVFAEDTAAQDITNACTVTAEGYDDPSFLHNKDLYVYKRSNGNASVTLTHPTGIASLYVMFDLEYGEYTIINNDSGAAATVGKNRFLHEFIDLQALFDTQPRSVTLKFESGSVRLGEIFAFTEGELPDFVQVWDAPLEGKADIVLFSTHGDDEHLFFAGLMPYYAKERGFALQVVYMTDHRNLTNTRVHEMLNGLWTVGVTAYPVFGDFEDFLIEDMELSYQEYESYGRSREELQSFMVRQLRRFRPQVAIGHDLMGEYKHGMHMIYADLLTKALDMTNDPAVFPDSAEQYGVWDVPKTYLHLYEENPIVLDYDIPLESFDGMTAFEVSQKLGYPCHESQQWTWLTGWINGKWGVKITKATEITQYNPCLFGLYRSTVGADVQKNDFMENIISYAEQERLEQERLEQERLEQERLEQERLEQERLEEERLEQERLEQERLEQERLEQEKLAQQQERQRRERELIALLILLGVLVVLLIVVSTILIKRTAKTRRRKNN